MTTQTNTTTAPEDNELSNWYVDAQGHIVYLPISSLK
jgi:hypothetical protein